MTRLVDEIRNDIIKALENESEGSLERGSETRLLRQLDRHHQAVGPTPTRTIIDLHIDQEKEAFEILRERMEENPIAVRLMDNLINEFLPEMKQRLYRQFP